MMETTENSENANSRSPSPTTGRRRAILWVIMPLAFVAAGFAAADRIAPDRPVGLVVVGKNAIEVNHDSREKPLSHVFMIHNPTAKPMAVSSIRSSCLCMATKFPSGEIPAGATVPFELTINHFDPHRLSFREAADLVTRAGKVMVQIRGTLPRPEKLLYRPEVIYMEPLANLATIEREIMVKVPAHLCRELATSDVCTENCPGVRVSLIEDPATEVYRHFRVVLTMDAAKIRQNVGRVRLDTGGGTVCVAVRFPTEERVP